MKDWIIIASLIVAALLGEIIGYCVCKIVTPQQGGVTVEHQYDYGIIVLDGTPLTINLRDCSPHIQIYDRNNKLIWETPAKETVNTIEVSSEELATKIARRYSAPNVQVVDTDYSHLKLETRFETPATLNLCDVIEITPADSNGIALITYLDPDKTKIDECAKLFFEGYLKPLCDSYIEQNCTATK